MKQVYVLIEGITCSHCISVLTKALNKIKNVKKVNIKNNIACISYVGKLDNKEIIKAIVDAGYVTKEEYISNDIKRLNKRMKLMEFLIILVSIFIIVLAINKAFGYNIFNAIPTIDSSITLGMLFITGVLTSIHCISMCGAINLMNALNKGKTRNFKRPIFYNLGRLISYTLVGAIVGLLGSVISINKTVSGIIIILAALIMLLMSLNMLGIINFKLPHVTTKFKVTNSFVIGLLNGLMPCGPLQAMQIYALSTGSATLGALSMFMFGLGTMPLMLGVGFLVNVINNKGKVIIGKIASVLMLILTFSMLNRGLLSLDIDVFEVFTNDKNYLVADISENVQIVEFDLSYDNYADIKVLKDVPVKMIINVSKDYLTGCNNEIVINEYGITKKLEEGVNIIEFTPTEAGVFTYTCWMNMIKNNIKVVERL